MLIQDFGIGLKKANFNVRPRDECLGVGVKQKHARALEMPIVSEPQFFDQGRIGLVQNSTAHAFALNGFCSKVLDGIFIKIFYPNFCSRRMCTSTTTPKMSRALFGMVSKRCRGSETPTTMPRSLRPICRIPPRVLAKAQIHLRYSSRHATPLSTPQIDFRGLSLPEWGVWFWL